MFYVGMKFLDIQWKTYGESSLSYKDRRWGTKERKENRIRYPSILSVNDEWWSLEKFSGVVNTLTIPPCEYGQ